MAYLALYREWRPRTFSEIVGQKHVTKTLINALTLDKVAHAYLFSGPRGTGKTTAAKILAKALNCEQRAGVEPCNECVSCTEIDRGAAMEVMEIDAASNRGIDEIRDLREKVKLSAARGRVKVYIIDEVHMLTTEAFNALLKTLEEPPQRVVFILATTEVHKIPLTILSRVQRFEFFRIALGDIQTRLLEVCTALERQVDPAALQVIAQKSEGGLRDALSILDQCLVQDDPLGIEQVYQVLGMVGETFSAQITDDLLVADYGKVLSSLSSAIQQGRDPRQILRELLDYLRQALLYLTTGQAPMIIPHLQEKLIQQSKDIGLSRLLLWIEVLMKGEGQLKYATNARLATELLLVEVIYKSQNNSSEKELLLGRSQQAAGVSGGNFATESLRTAKTKPQVQANLLKEDSKIQDLPKIAVGGSEGKASKGDLTIEAIQSRWSEVLENVRKRKKSTHAFLLEGKPGSIEENIVTLVFKNGFSFHREKVDQLENRQTIEEAFQLLFGIKLAIRGIMENELNQQSEPAVEEDLNGQALIKRTRDIFGSGLVVVKEET